MLWLYPGTVVISGNTGVGAEGVWSEAGHSLPPCLQSPPYKAGSTRALRGAEVPCAAPEVRRNRRKPSLGPGWPASQLTHWFRQSREVLRGACPPLRSPAVRTSFCPAWLWPPACPTVASQSASQDAPGPSV